MASVRIVFTHKSSMGDCWLFDAPFSITLSPFLYGIKVV
jgi:hypothetical protein